MTSMKVTKAVNAKAALAAASMAVLLSTTALAGDGNKAYLDQNGSNNTALIQQSGNDNEAGDSGAQNRIQQDGHSNVLNVLQSGNNANLGTGGNYNHLNLGVDQIGDYNKLTTKQTGAGSINTIQQDSVGFDSPVNVVNEITINQLNGNGSTLVSRVDQKYLGNGTSDAKNLVTIDQNVNGTGPSVGGGGPTGQQSGGVFQTGFANTVDIDQTGKYHRTNEVRQEGDNNNFTVEQVYDNTGGGFNGNTFDLGEQYGTSNTATVRQLGANNHTELVKQDTRPFGTIGNRANIVLDGDSNGKLGLSGVAAASGAWSSTVLQYGDDNEVDLTILGDDNSYGVTQYGDSNDALDITISGNGNELGVYQNGVMNEVIIGEVAGDGNAIGVAQSGTNLAEVNILRSDSDNNDVFVTQSGENNDTKIDIGTVGGSSENAVNVEQIGMSNDADVEIWAGNSNYLNIKQDGVSPTGGGNTVDVFLHSSFANVGSAASFSGNADISASGSLEPTFGPGDIFQTGSNNAVTLDVSLTGAVSLRSSFGFEQTGDGNAINGEIQGDDNQVAVVQNGSTNTAAFSQLGNNNNIGVIQ